MSYSVVNISLIAYGCFLIRIRLLLFLSILMSYSVVNISVIVCGSFSLTVAAISVSPNVVIFSSIYGSFSLTTL